MNAFRLAVDTSDMAMDLAGDLIDEALSQGLSEDEVIDSGTYTFDAEFVGMEGNEAVYLVTVEGPNAARVAQLVNEFQEPCPTAEYGPPCDALTCLMTSPRFQDMTVREAITELKANGLLPE